VSFYLKLYIYKSFFFALFAPIIFPNSIIEIYFIFLKLYFFIFFFFFFISLYLFPFFKGVKGAINFILIYFCIFLLNSIFLKVCCPHNFFFMGVLPPYYRGIFYFSISRLMFLYGCRIIKKKFIFFYFLHYSLRNTATKKKNTKNQKQKD